MEAMSNGCIPIVSRFASQPEVVSEFGYIVNEISKEEIVKKIEIYFNLSVEKKDLLKKEILDYTHKKILLRFSSKKNKKCY